MMKQNGEQLTFRLVISVLLAVLIGFVVVEPASSSEDNPATAAEMQFINLVMDQVKMAVPQMDGWKRYVTAYTSDNFQVPEGGKATIFPSSRYFPLKLSISFKFHLITSAEKKRSDEKAQTTQSAEALQEQMMAALASGDMEKMMQLQQQLLGMAQKSTEQSALGMAAQGNTAPEKATEFQVQVIVNGEGAHIGKKYDMAMPGVTHAFRIDKKKNNDYLSYKYYLGSWDVSEFDRVNWNIAFPKSLQTPANHLHTKVLRVNIYGDRKSVEQYVKSSLDLDKLNKLID